MMANYLVEKEYWQVKATGEIMECPAMERSVEWLKAYRRVRLYHHQESETVFNEDYFASERVLQRHWENQAVEVNLEQYLYWKLIYDNPDL